MLTDRNRVAGKGWFAERRLALLILVAAGTGGCAAPADGPRAGVPAAPGVPGLAADDGGSIPIAVDGPAGTPQSGGAAAQPAAGEAAAQGEKSPIHGSLITRYVGRDSHHSGQDQDLYALLEASVGDATKDPWNAYVSGRVSRDLDGGVNNSTSPFHGLEDTYGNATDARLYEAWVNWRAKGFDLLRLGRQTIWDAPEFVRFDGATAETAPDGTLRQQFGAYGGQPAHLYETSPAGDELFGVYWKARPWDGGRTRLDFMHIRDGQLLGDVTDNLYAIDVRQQVGEELGLQGHYTLLGSVPRDVDFRATWNRPQDGWLAQLSYHELLNPQTVQVEEFDPFSNVLLTYEPYWQARVMAAKSFESGYDLQAGADMRRLNNTEQAGQFNREYERTFVTGTVRDLGTKGLAVSGTAERWSGDGSQIATWGVDVTREWTKDVSASVGSYFSLFKNDFLLGQDRQDVRTWYLNFKYRTDPSLTWSFGFEHEDNPVDDYNTLTARASWRF